MNRIEDDSLKKNLSQILELFVKSDQAAISRKERNE